MLEAKKFVRKAKRKILKMYKESKQFSNDDLEKVAKTEDAEQKLRAFLNDEEYSELASRYEKKWLITLSRRIERVVSIVESPSFFKDMERKPRIERIADQLDWRIRTGFYNAAYNEYGLDIQNFRSNEDYYERYLFKRMNSQKHHRNTDPNRHIMMSNNKLWFYSYMDSIKEGMVPKVHLAFRDGIVAIPFRTYDSVESALEALPVQKYVAKLSGGQKGEGFFKFEKTDSGEITVNEGSETYENFLEAMKTGSYLVQDFVVQHEIVSTLAPGSVNTVRIVTSRYKNEAHIFYALIRMSAKSGALIDNATQGGTFVGIDEKTGKLKKYGGYFYQHHYDLQHPITGITYEGYQLPYWDEITSLVTDLHQYLRGFLIIGWDIAITENGPIIIEINASPCSKMAQMANGGLQAKWDELRTLP